jgi:glycosyltransferase involved in cell wall biosynthesis
MLKHPQAQQTRRPRVLFVNRSYWPDAEATGQLLTELCRDLASWYDVHVIAGQPNLNPEQLPFRRRGSEVRDGVVIHRVWHTQFSKATFLGRLSNYLTFLATALVAAWRAPRAEAIVVETDPPLLCLLGWLACRWHGCRLVVYLQDIYPDIAVALGKLSRGRLSGWLRRLFFHVYRSADQLVVLSDDMRAVLVDGGVSEESIRVIPNWVDTTLVRPAKEGNRFRAQHGLDGKFVVMYSGNMGLCQKLDTVMLAAEQLEHRADIVFLLVGDGASRPRLEAWARRRRLSNVRFLDYRPKSELADSLSAADVHLVPVDPRVTRYLMPSKLYGILASGTPLITVAPPDCQLARLTTESGVGRAVPPVNPQALAAEIRWCAEHRHQLSAMGAAARSLAVRCFDRRISTGRFFQMLSGLLDDPRTVSEPPTARAA